MHASSLTLLVAIALVVVALGSWVGFDTPCSMATGADTSQMAHSEHTPSGDRPDGPCIDDAPCDGNLQCQVHGCPHVAAGPPPTMDSVAATGPVTTAATPEAGWLAGCAPDVHLPPPRA